MANATKKDDLPTNNFEQKFNTLIKMNKCCLLPIQKSTYLTTLRNLK